MFYLYSITDHCQYIDHVIFEDSFQVLSCQIRSLLIYIFSNHPHRTNDHRLQIDCGTPDFGAKCDDVSLFKTSFIFGVVDSYQLC